jgi:hypothetical protein
MLPPHTYIYLGHQAPQADTRLLKGISIVLEEQLSVWQGLFFGAAFEWIVVM